MSAASPAARRYDLDWVRIGAFALLILYHVGMFYVPWPFHVKSPRVVEEIEPLMRLTNPWRLSLLFFVSGAATRFMAESRPVETLLGERMGRLLPPLVFGMLVVVPPQTWFQIVEALGYEGGVFDFYRRYVTASGHWRIDGEPLITPTWNHLWFVAYLAVYTLLLSGLLKVAGPQLRRLGERLGDLPAPALLALPIVWLAVTRSLLAPRFPETHALVDDLYAHSVYLPTFLLGFLIAKHERAWRSLEQLRWPAAGVAAISYLAIATYGWIYRGDLTPALDLRVPMRVVYAVDQWAWIVAITGFASRHLRGVDNPARRYLTDAIFPFYIAHQTIIVVAGHYLARAGLPLGLEAFLLVTITTVGCFATYEVVRRVVWLRPLFGLKALRRSGRPEPAAAAA